MQRLFHLNLPKQEHFGGRESADRPNFPVRPRIFFCPKIRYLLGSGLSGLGLVKFGFTQKNPVPIYELGLNLKSMIAEAAYYKAEKRNFYPGHKIRDRLEANKEMFRQFYNN